MLTYIYILSHLLFNDKIACKFIHISTVKPITNCLIRFNSSHYSNVKTDYRIVHLYSFLKTEFFFYFLEPRLLRITSDFNFNFFDIFLNNIGGGNIYIYRVIKIKFFSFDWKRRKQLWEGGLWQPHFSGQISIT